MSIQFKPFKRAQEEEYDNLARGLRTTWSREQVVTAHRDFEQPLAEIDKKWAEEGEP